MSYMESGEKKYKNGDITIYWKPASCIHASTCINELPTVFKADKKPWVRMEGGSTEEIIKVVNRCPVDALTWKYNDLEKNKNIGKEHPNHVANMRKNLLTKIETDDSERVSIKIIENGPFLVNGSFYLEREDGSKSKFNGTISLCKCGKSKVKPFCDGSHRE